MMNKFLLERLKRAALLVLLIIAGRAQSLAQTQVATLQHGDTLSAFYGPYAFMSAHYAAQHGDVITLSGGTFVPTTITKAITLRGAGCVTDSLTQTVPTTFANDITLNVSDATLGNVLNVEGILFMHKVKYQNLSNPTFTRCKFDEITYYQYASNILMNGAQFINCIIRSANFSQADRTTLINSVVWEAGFGYLTTVVGLTDFAYNSIVRAISAVGNNVGNSNYRTFHVYNSVVIDNNSSGTSSYFSNNACYFYNCIGIKLTTEGSPFYDNFTTNCAIYRSYSDVFESFSGTFTFDDEEELFILNDSIATSFLGSDGTQVGIHGGNVPYSTRPSYMTPMRCNVANQSTNEGKLEVEIEVVNEGE